MTSLSEIRVARLHAAEGAERLPWFDVPDDVANIFGGFILTPTPTLARSTDSCVSLFGPAAGRDADAAASIMTTTPGGRPEPAAYSGRLRAQIAPSCPSRIQDQE